MDSLTWSQSVSASTTIRVSNQRPSAATLGSVDFAALFGASQLPRDSFNLARSDWFGAGNSERNENRLPSPQPPAGTDGGGDRTSDSYRSVEFDHRPTDNTRSESEESEESSQAVSDPSMASTQLSPLPHQSTEISLEVGTGLESEMIQPQVVSIDPSADSSAEDVPELLTITNVDAGPRPLVEVNIESTTSSLSNTSESQSFSTFTSAGTQRSVTPDDVAEPQGLAGQSAFTSHETALDTTQFASNDLLATDLTIDVPMATQSDTVLGTKEASAQEQARETRNPGNRRGRSTRRSDRPLAGQSKLESRASQGGVSPNSFGSPAIASVEDVPKHRAEQSSVASNSVSPNSAGSQTELPGQAVFPNASTTGLQEFAEHFSTDVSRLPPGASVQVAKPIVGETSAQSMPLTVGSDTTAIRSNEITGVDRPIAGQTTGHVSSQELPATEANSTDPTSRLRQSEQIRLIQRVARSFNRLSADGGSVQLRLHPPELGSLSMQVRLEGRNMIAQMTTESAAAREVILESLPQLRSRLAQQGFEVTQITVDVADPSATGSQGDSRNPTSFGSQQNGQGNGGQTATDLRRSAAMRRQLDAGRVASHLPTNSSTAGMRGIDLHA